jgi:cytochrome c peroxidase
MPTIKNCQACHGGEVVADRVPSTCTFCHDFHLPHLGPMRDIKTVEASESNGWFQQIMTTFGARK